MAAGRVLIYGAYGYTGELIARAARGRGWTPILGGRRPQPLGDLADIHVEETPPGVEHDANRRRTYIAFNVRNRDVASGSGGAGWVSRQATRSTASMKMVTPTHLCQE